MASVDELRSWSTTRHQTMKKPIERTTSENVFIAQVPLAYSKQWWSLSDRHPSKHDSVAYLVEEERSYQRSLSSLDNGDTLDDRVIKGITLPFMVIGVNLNKYGSNSPITSSLTEDESDVFITDP